MNAAQRCSGDMGLGESMKVLEAIRYKDRTETPAHPCTSPDASLQLGDISSLCRAVSLFPYLCSQG